MVARDWASRSAIDPAAASVYAKAFEMSVLRSASPCTSSDNERHGGVEPIGLVAERAEQHVEVVDDLTDELVPIGQRVGHDRRLLQKRSDGGALTLQSRNQLAAELIDLLGIQCPKQRLETADHRIQIKGGPRPGHRDRLARFECPESTGPFLQREIPPADHVVVADFRPGALGQHDRIVGGELHLYRRVGIERDVDRSGPPRPLRSSPCRRASCPKRS